MANILIIDDDKQICDALSKVIKGMGHHVTYMLTLKEGLGLAQSEEFDVVLLDVFLPDGNGLEALPKIRALSSSPEVIIMTGQGAPDGAALAIKSGAWDYLQKPGSIDQITLPLVRALQYRQEKKPVKPLVALNREGIIGNSQPMKACFDLLAQAAYSKANVLITGETGTGKELFAWATHKNSPREDKSFVVVDCASIPESLVESALFGHKKGAFTGAHEDKDGLIKQAHGGTLFLDEVGELPLPLQGAFLRVLQEHRFRPLGGKREIESDFRLLAATNRDLDEMVQGGRFRKDLLFRIRAVTIELPPLRERTKDIIDLVMYHMKDLCEDYGIGIKGLSPEVLEILTSYKWPGNVRELVNTLERALAAARSDDTLFPKHLPAPIRIHVARASFSKDITAKKPRRVAAMPSPEHLPPLKAFRDSLVAEGERQYLEDLMSLNGWDMKKACQMSGLGRARLYGLMRKYNISRAG